jgi:hypothetical protein
MKQCHQIRTEVSKTPQINHKVKQINTSNLLGRLQIEDQIGSIIQQSNRSLMNTHIPDNRKKATTMSFRSTIRANMKGKRRMV